MLTTPTQTDYGFSTIKVSVDNREAKEKEIELIKSISPKEYNGINLIEVGFESDSETYFLCSMNGTGLIKFKIDEFAEEFIDIILEPVLDLKKEYEYWLKGDLTYFCDKGGQLASMIRETNLYQEHLCCKVRKEKHLPYQWKKIPKIKEIKEFIAINEQIFELKEELMRLGV